jgi:hypothetical protein
MIRIDYQRKNYFENYIKIAPDKAYSLSGAVLDHIVITDFFSKPYSASAN